MLSIFSSQIFIILYIIFSLLIIIFIISIIECNTYKINSYDIITNKINNNIKIVFISDFHDKSSDKYISNVISDILKLKPDYIVIGGDFIEFSRFSSFFGKVKTNNALRFIKKLTSIIDSKKDNCDYNIKRVFISYGNHELRLRDRFDNEKLTSEYNKIIDVIKSCGIDILDNNIIDIGDNITISGLSLYKGYYGKIFSRYKIYDSIDINILNDTFKTFDDSKYNIISFHKPDYYKDLIDFGFDLVLSGHNHGGLINFPIIGCIFSPDLKLFPKYNHGLYDFNGKKLLVSNGLGEHFIKIRVNNRPEICLININGTNNI